MQVDARRLIVMFLIAVGLLSVVAATISVRGSGDDWKIFWTAGHYVGSSKLLDVAHFVYMPGAAWTLWPFSQLPREIGYFAFAALSLALSLAAAGFASRVYGISREVAVAMALLWWPLTIALCLGQYAGVALFLTMLAVVGLACGREMLFAVAVGLLLYKPTMALPFILLVPLFRLWRAAGVIAALGAIWYVLSASAVGTFLWVGPYMHALSALYRVDRIVDGDWAISLPGVLIHMGLSPLAGWVFGALLLFASLGLFAGAARREAATMAPVIGLATTPHAYGYDALLLLPCLWWFAGSRHRLRIPSLIAVYCVAPFYLLSRRLHFDALAIDVVAIALAWSVWRVRRLLRARGNLAKDGEMPVGTFLPSETRGASDALPP